MTKMRSFVALAAASTMAFMGLSGCSSSPEEQEAKEPQSGVEITVFAAASLNKAFPEIVDEVLKPDHPDITVNFSFEGSSTLVDQIKSGAPADVFASADERNMDKAVEADLVDDVQPFASNVLTLITPAGNPAGITGLDDSLEGKNLVVCAPEVPCGNATKMLADNVGVELHPVSEEQKVTDVRGKVENGQADAGLVYATDAKAAGDKVDVIEVKGSDSVINAYPIALVHDSDNAKEAQLFIDAVLSEKGQKILESYGFLPPVK